MSKAATIRQEKVIANSEGVVHLKIHDQPTPVVPEMRSDSMVPNPDLFWNLFGGSIDRGQASPTDKTKTP